jgi:hypothetical protein
MSDHTVELFILKCAVIETGLRATLAEFDTGGSGAISQTDDEQLEPFIKQFDIANRKNAAHMSRYYEIFYLLGPVYKVAMRRHLRIAARCSASRKERASLS